MKSTVKIKKIFALLMCLVLMFVTFIPIMADSDDQQKLEVVLVVDDSGSMANTDPDRLSAIAISKFVDVIPADADVTFGITTYARELMPGSLELGQSRNAIKNFANDTSKITQDGVGTDAAKGVDWGVNQLITKGDSGDNTTKAIILIGDGKQETANDTESNNMLDAAIDDAADKGIKIYALAINPEDEEFKQFFNNIATNTGGKLYEPTTTADLDTCFDEIVKELVGNAMQHEWVIPCKSHVPQTKTVTLPDGVYEMNLQCDFKTPVDITFTTPSKDTLNKDSDGVTYIEEDAYSNYKVREPEAGEWTITCLSNTDQDITIQLVFFTDVSMELSKNQTEVKQKSPVQYTSLFKSHGNAITDNERLEGMNVNLVVTKIDENGNPGKPSVEKMEVKDGKFFIEYKIKDFGRHQVYAEIEGDEGIKSNVLDIDVIEVKPLIPTWLLIILIILGVILLVLIIFFIIRSRNAPGTGFVFGNVALKIISRIASDETMIFQNDKFNCETIFVKKNTLSDLVTAYIKRYRINNSGELAEMTLNQHLNSVLTEVTDKITICGNKKKQTIITIPATNEMSVDGMDLSKPRTIKFSSPERVVELRFKNKGCTYTLTLTFTRM